MDRPLAYFITFRTYGSWLHGDLRGSVDRKHAAYGEEFVPRDDMRRRVMAASLKNVPPVLTPGRRRVVESAVREACATKEWDLIAVNVRTNHVHLVIWSPEPPEAVMRALKAWCTRRLRESGLSGANEKVWSRHGSTRYLWNERDVAGATTYVVDGQGPNLDPR